MKVGLVLARRSRIAWASDTCPNSGEKKMKESEQISAAKSLTSQARANALAYNLRDHGFQISDGPLLTAEETALVREHAKRVLNGIYETGVPPRTNTGGPDASVHPAYIEAQMPQDCDDVIASAIKHPGIARWAAEISGARRLKIWNAMVMEKRPSGGDKTKVGWHQDRRYNENITRGPTLTVWVALADVPSELGPVRYVARSHLWNRRFQTGFFDRDIERQEREFDIPAGEKWQAVEAVLPAGWAVAHGPDILHGSGENYGDAPRTSLLLSLGIDDFEVLPTHYFASRQGDPRAAPVIYPTTE